jgi:hypothetical protein
MSTQERVTGHQDRPRLAGDRDGDHYSTCGHQDQYDKACQAGATVHLWITDQDGDGAVLACDRCAPVARQAGLLVMEHAADGLCGLPGTAWETDRNVCVLDDTGRP